MDTLSARTRQDLRYIVAFLGLPFVVEPYYIARILDNGTITHPLFYVSYISQSYITRMGLTVDSYMESTL